MTRGEKRRLNRSLLDAMFIDDLSGAREALRRGANVDTDLWEHDETPLMLARGDAVRRLLLDHGASVHARDNRGRTAFMIRPCAVLLEAGAEIDAQDIEDQTALIRAAEMGDGDLVQWLIDRGADRHIGSATGETALDRAQEFGLRHIVAILERAGATEDER